MTAQRSRVRPRISAHIAATMMGRPRIEPELSSSRVTTVSRKLVSFSRLKDSGYIGIDDDARQARGVEQAFFQVELPMPVLLRQQQALQLVGQPRHHALHLGKLLVEETAQPRQFLGVAKIGGGNLFVELLRVRSCSPSDPRSAKGGWMRLGCMPSSGCSVSAKSSLCSPLTSASLSSPSSPRSSVNSVSPVSPWLSLSCSSLPWFWFSLLSPSLSSSPEWSVSLALGEIVQDGAGKAGESASGRASRRAAWRDPCPRVPR